MKTIKLKLLIFCLIISILFCNNLFFVNAETIYPSGMSLEDDSDIVFENAVGWGNITNLPSIVDLTENFPTPQQQIGESCTGWTIGYALKSYQEFNKRQWTKNTENHIFNPYYIYNKVNGGSNIPVSLKKALKQLETSGACPSTYYSLTDSTIRPATSLENAAASLYKVNDIQNVYSVSNMKNYLYNGHAVVLGIRIAPDFRNINNTNDTYDDKSNLENVGHSICLIGYDDQKGAFKFINSWGTKWGLDGYGWISYDLVNDPFVNYYYLEKGFVIVENVEYDYILGDVNNDKIITAADSRLVLRFSSKLESFTDKQQVLADVDGNGIVEAADSRHIMRYSSGLISQFPLYD